jgi:CBS domain-containing protein
MNDPLERLLEQKTGGLEVVTPQTSVLDAVARMNQRTIGSVLVMEGERLVGIFTERDVLTRVVPRQLDPTRTPVAEVMTRQLVTVSPATTVQEAMMIITDTRHRHLPVIQGGRLIAMVSTGDLTRWLVRDQQRTIDGLVDYVRRG